MQEDQIVSNKKSKVSTTSVEIAKEIYAMRTQALVKSNDELKVNENKMNDPYKSLKTRYFKLILNYLIKTFLVRQLQKSLL